jgi:hypothetical protein
MADYEFNLMELLEELENDDSWEPDPEVRKAIVMGLVGTIVGRA